MRPVRVELEGFSAFREPTVVDFTDADLFAFVGPTGAGKSSVIDGMVFALYGSVPRYGREGLVHPVISQGRPEARVRLDFEVHGVAHTAVRVVRRTKTGASTKEARLERGGEVLAADAPSVTAAVCDLLGLDLEGTCLALPVGVSDHVHACLRHDRLQVGDVRGRHLQRLRHAAQGVADQRHVLRGGRERELDSGLRLHDARLPPASGG